MIQELGEYYCLHIGNDCVSDIASEFDEFFVKLTYYISDKELTDENYELSFLTSYYNGYSKADNSYCYGTSWTCIYGQNDEFIIGNRDVIRELSNFIGKYCYFILTVEK